MIGWREISESASSVPNNSVGPRLKPFLLQLPPNPLPASQETFYSQEREDAPSHLLPRIESSSSCVGFRWRNPAEPVCLSSTVVLGYCGTLPEQLGAGETGGRQGRIRLCGTAERGMVQRRKVGKDHMPLPRMRTTPEAGKPSGRRKTRLTHWTDCDPH